MKILLYSEDFSTVGPYLARSYARENGFFFMKIVYHLAFMKGRGHHLTLDILQEIKKISWAIAAF